MGRYSEILLDVWREACRHIEIAEATDLITPLVLRQLPLDPRAQQESVDLANSLPPARAAEGVLNLYLVEKLPKTFGA